MRPIETTVIMIYLIGMVLIGIYFAKKALSTEEDYWVAGRKINSFVGSFAIFAAVASGSSLYGSIGSGVAYGLPYYLALALGSIGLFPFALFIFAAQMRRSGVLTLPGYFAKRYGASVQLLSSMIVVIFMTLYIVPQLTTSGYIGSYVLGLPYINTVILIGIGITIYAAIGGMWAITYTDLVQGILMVAGVGILAIVILLNSGDFNSLFESAVNADPTFTQVTLPRISYFGIFFVFIWFAVVAPSAIMRNLSSKSARAARRSMMGGTLLFILLFVSGLFILLAGIGLDVKDTVDNADLVFLQVIEHYLSPVLAGVLAASILASIMSSTDAFLLAVSSGVAHDIYKGFINKKAKEKLVTRIGLVVMFLAATIAIILAIDPPQLIQTMVAWVSGGMVSSFSAPILLGLWWKRANKPGALFGMLSGFVSYITLMIMPTTALVSEVIIATPISFIVMVIVSLITREPPAEIQREVELNHTAIND